MSVPLDSEFIDRIASDPDPIVRLRLAVQLASVAIDPDATEEELATVGPVLLKLSADPDKEVRRAIAGVVGTSPHAPIDLVFSIAADDEDIACPVIEGSQALDERALLAMMEVCDQPRLEAIACRRGLTREVVHQLIRRGDEDVLASLLENPDSRIDADGYRLLHARIKQAKHAVELEQMLQARPDLPVEMKATLLSARARRLVAFTRQNSWLGARGADAVIGDVEERALAKLIEGAGRDEVAALARHLARSGSLTPSLILRAACIGRMDFVEQAFSVLTRTPARRVHNMLFSGATGLRALQTKARLPASLVPPLRVATDVYRDLAKSRDPADRRRFGRLMIERTLTAYEGFSEADKRYLLKVLSRYGGGETAVLAKKLLSEFAVAA